MEGFVKILDTSKLSLDSLKAYRHIEVDYNTGVLISAGFTFDSKQFSLSSGAQLNWSEIHSNQGDFSFPLDISTIDNDTYSLVLLDIDAFWTSAKDTLKGHLDSGRALKKSIFDAIDVSAVNLILDDR